VMEFGISRRSKSRSHKRVRGVVCLRVAEKTDGKMNWNEDKPIGNRENWRTEVCS